jgi:hypothetical protein
MKKPVFLHPILAGLAVLAALAALASPAPPLAAAENDGERLNEAVDKVIGHWKRNFVAPAYGVALFSVDILARDLPGVTSGFDDDTFLAPAVDLRVFRGVTVSKDGRFYTGLETGAFVFLPFSHSFTDPNVQVDDTPDGGVVNDLGDLEFKVSPYGGIAFLTAKYGFRTDVGASKAVSVGLELGAGGTVYAGGFDIWMGDKDDPTYEAAGTSDTTRLSFLLDASAEGAFRVGKGGRMFLKGSVIYSPVIFEMSSFPPLVGNGVIDSDLGALTTYALNNYELELRPFVYDLRVGFIVNFD